MQLFNRGFLPLQIDLLGIFSDKSYSSAYQVLYYPDLEDENSCQQ